MQTTINGAKISYYLIPGQKGSRDKFGWDEPVPDDIDIIEVEVTDLERFTESMPELIRFIDDERELSIRLHNRYFHELIAVAKREADDDYASDLAELNFDEVG